MKVLRKHDLHKNTLFVFTSDNGPWLNYGDHAGSALPLREGKGTMFDGGCREPTLAWWPGTIPPGSECKEPAMTIDLLPTIAKLIDSELPSLPMKHTTSITGTNYKPFVRESGNCIFHTDTGPWPENQEELAEFPQIILRQK